MASSPNGLRCNGRPGHYEVHSLTLTDPATGLGYTLSGWQFEVIARKRRLVDEVTATPGIEPVLR